MYFPGYCCPWKFIQIIDLIGGLPGSLNNEQANSALSHVSFKSEIQSIKDKKHFTAMFFSVWPKGKSSPEQRDIDKKIFNATEAANMNCMLRAADQSSQISHLLALSHYIFIYIMEILERQPSNNILPERPRDSCNVLKRGAHHNHNQSPDYLQLSALFITAGSQ